MAKEKTDVRLDPETLEEARRQAAIDPDTTVSDVLRRWIRRGREKEQEESK